MGTRIVAALAAGLLASVAAAHEGSRPGKGKGNKPPPLAVLQLDEVRNATARFLDVDQALKEGYADIGLFMPKMGWHYMKESLVDGKFDADETRVARVRGRSVRRQAQARRGGIRGAARAVEAGAGGIHRPRGRVGCEPDVPALDAARLGVEYNPDGVFAPFNPRVP